MYLFCVTILPSQAGAAAMRMLFILYADPPNGPQPDYVLDAAARAYRNLHRPELAANLYLRGLRHHQQCGVRGRIDPNSDRSRLYREGPLSRRR